MKRKELDMMGRLMKDGTLTWGDKARGSSFPVSSPLPEGHAH